MKFDIHEALETVLKQVLLQESKKINIIQEIDDFLPKIAKEVVLTYPNENKIRQKEIIKRTIACLIAKEKNLPYVSVEEFPKYFKNKFKVKSRSNSASKIDNLIDNILNDTIKTYENNSIISCSGIFSYLGKLKLFLKNKCFPNKNKK